MDEDAAYRLRQFAEDSDRETLRPLDWFTFHQFVAFVQMFKRPVTEQEVCASLEGFGFTHAKAAEISEMYSHDRQLLNIYDDLRAGVRRAYSE